ncbi:hypothetical protein CR513_62659, partial [Mucuna pruriens]
MDDIIFSVTNEHLLKNFFDLMQSKFDISMKGELNRYDIMLFVCLCARFHSDLKESHLKVVKRIFRYLIVTTNLNLSYKKNQDFKLVRYCDVDYAGDKIERKTISEGCHFIRPCLVSWVSKKHTSIALSIVEAKICFSNKLFFTTFMGKISIRDLLYL